MADMVLQPQAPEQDWWALPWPWLGEGPHSPAPTSLGRESGPGQVLRARTWAYLDHHTAPDVVPSDGDPSVSVILLWGSDRLPIPAAARFSVSQSFGCGDLSTWCWFSKQDPIRCSSVPHSCPRLPRYACMHMSAHDACCIYVSAYICMSAHVCKC